MVVMIRRAVRSCSEQNSSSSSQPAPAQMKATIIYLPPFLHSCRNVPSRSTTAPPTAVDGGLSGASSRLCHGSCCHQEHKIYDEHSATAQRLPATVARSSRKAKDRRRGTHENGMAPVAKQPAVPSAAVAPLTTKQRRQTAQSAPSTSALASSVSLQRDRINEDRKIKTQRHSCPVDSFRLRNSQLVVMPIGGECRLGNAVDAPGAAANISHTTTLDCRCFKENGDILLEDVCCTGCSHTCTHWRLPRRTLPVPAHLAVQQMWQRLPLHAHLTKTLAAPKLLLIVLMLLSISWGDCWAGRQDATNCTFPARWEGSWFLSGYQQSIHIKGSQFSYRGKCAASDGNKFLIVDEKGCHRCLVIYEKHKNVLQYKESECEGDSMYLHQSNPSVMAMRSVLKQNGGDHRGGAHPNTNGHSRLSSSDQYILRSNDDMNDYFCKGRETLQNLCDQIPGDALLYSLFREHADPVKCPLKGPFVFTYNRGHGECKSPVSNIESCTEESRLLLSFQACPDVQGTESTVEELTCLATWKDGNSRYLVGLVSHHHAISNEERYRCFVYEKISSLMGGPSMVTSKDAEYKLAQSGDATCNGLDSAEVGSRIMSLRKPPLAERCDFPVWFKGPRHWHALMGNAVYNYHSNDGSVHVINNNGIMDTRALCEQINKQTSTEMMAVVHYTTGCQSGFMCMMFYRRDTHVIEIQTGKQASRLEDACAPDHFDTIKMPFITLLASNPDPQICPMEGLYNLRGAIGPPFLTTRHKRNHNNKAHAGHAHHHQNEEPGAGNASGLGHKRHGTLTFRNADRIDDRGSWHANTRGRPARNRRAAAALAQSHESADRKNSSAKKDNGTNVSFLVTEMGLAQRNRRNAPPCITNYKAQRQLWVGCTEPNVIDVRPLCTDEGDEEYNCHGSWSENGTVYIIARHKGSKHGVCISYRPTEGSSAKLVIGDACYRGTDKPPEHHVVADLSVFGKCGETGSSSARTILNNWLTTLAVALLSTSLPHWHLASALCFPTHR